MAEDEFLQLELPSGRLVQFRKFISANSSIALTDSLSHGDSARTAFLKMLVALSVRESGTSIDDLKDVLDEHLMSIGQAYIERWNKLKTAFEDASDEDDFFARFVEGHNKATAELFHLPESFIDQINSFKNAAKLPDSTIAAFKKATESTDLLKKLINPASYIVTAKPIIPSVAKSTIPDGLRDFKPAVVQTNELLNEFLKQQDKNQEVQQVISQTLQSLLEAQIKIAEDTKADAKRTLNLNYWILSFTAASVLIGLIALLITA